MNLSGAKSRLVGVTKELNVRWDETKEHWRDSKSAEFEKRFLTDLFTGVDKSVTVIEKLDVLLARVQKDCE
jgi:hypothetical protein